MQVGVGRDAHSVSGASGNAFDPHVANYNKLNYRESWKKPNWHLKPTLKAMLILRAPINTRILQCSGMLSLALYESHVLGR